MKKFTIGSTIGNIIDDVIGFVKRNWKALFFIGLASYWTFLGIQLAARFMLYTDSMYHMLAVFFNYVMSHHGTIL
jgi:hypothetical protein